ncbi:MAG: exopolysaccharide biosynthesis polyprenyl glycosylphosphotransferase [Sphingomonas sp.]|uniref:exopolysaccharide biosynthesis polyprenyl glycosylphosphotransferase n=1 Tax=Sphingomonas sp. TaxID=28214 RepID=UPI001B2D7E5C|nr:exopolysaccharide biosynthesis polyprenyl glycosylphosphotransferase [Sphingomonas sp.]MBO9621736.1 exopolysaccharide biosynthesis polyprenyl glycosylphosphotransferase [Sphingomonas sp.]
MSKIDLAIRGYPSRTPFAAAAKRNAKVWLCLTLIAADAVALLAGFAVGLQVEQPGSVSANALTSLAGVLLVHAGIAFQNQAYSTKCLTSATASVRQALLSLAGTMLLFLLVVFSLKVTGRLPRFALSLGILSTVALVIGQRLLLCHFVQRTCGGQLQSELVIVDGGNVPDHCLASDIIDARTASLRSDLDDPYMLNRLGTVLRDYDRVVICCAPERKGEWAQVLKGANIQGEIIIPELGELGPLAIHQLSGVTTVVVSRGPLNLADRAKKRALDILLTVPVLIMLLPALVAVALAIRFDSPGPIFFRQERMGRGNRIFHILKFRSMRVETSDSDGTRSASRDDDRITRVGRFIRKTSIDELPQLINVLLGDMSLVGPRPHALGSRAGDELFWRVDRQYWHRHALKPGITGLAQIRGFRGATEHRSDIVNRLESDLEYLQDWSLMRDIGILARTAQVLVHKNAY